VIDPGFQFGRLGRLAFFCHFAFRQWGGAAGAEAALGYLPHNHAGASNVGAASRTRGA
jgi:hypothetical protein